MRVSFLDHGTVEAGFGVVGKWGGKLGRLAGGGWGVRGFWTGCLEANRRLGRRVPPLLSVGTAWRSDAPGAEGIRLKASGNWGGGRVGDAARA